MVTIPDATFAVPPAINPSCNLNAPAGNQALRPNVSELATVMVFARGRTRTGHSQGTAKPDPPFWDNPSSSSSHVIDHRGDRRERYGCRELRSVPRSGTSTH